MRRHPQAYDFAILQYFSVWCSFIFCEKISTQKLSHSFLRLDISAVDNISNVLLLTKSNFVLELLKGFLSGQLLNKR